MGYLDYRSTISRRSPQQSVHQRDRSDKDCSNEDDWLLDRHQPLHQLRIILLFNSMHLLVVLVHLRRIIHRAEFGVNRPLFLFDFPRQFAKLFGLLVARLYLQLCELSRVLSRQDRRQGLQFRRYFACVIGLFQHQMFKLPDCLVVIHRPRFGVDSSACFTSASLASLPAPNNPSSRSQAPVYCTRPPFD
jgi:hypothetical protein